MHFDKPAVLQALQSMERHKSRRKMGQRAGADLQDIARKIEENYKIGWFKLVGDGCVEFHINGLKIRCKDKPGAVALVVAKYRRGVPKRNWRAA